MEKDQQSPSIESILKSYSQEFVKSQTMESIIPRQFSCQKDLEGITNNLYYRQEASHLQSLTKSLSEPIWDLLDRGGKKWRPILCMLIAELYGTPKENVFEIAALCEIVHNGTLMVDDIQDSSTVRRNKPCVHLLYGVDISLNAGNFMYFAPMHYLSKSPKFSKEQVSQLSTIYVEEMLSLHVGQGWDILWHNVDKLDKKYPTEEQYLQMTAHKTGVLARLSSKLTCTYLNVSQKQTQTLYRFAEAMGVAFQIQDDLLNLEGQQFKKTKGYNGEDIHEGKMSLIVLHFLHNASEPDRQKMVTILKKKTEEPSQINEAIEMLRKAGSLTYAKQRMHKIMDEAWAKIEEHLPNGPAKRLIKQLGYFGIKRNH